VIKLIDFPRRRQSSAFINTQNKTDASGRKAKLTKTALQIAARDREFIQRYGYGHGDRHLDNNDRRYCSVCDIFCRCDAFDDCQARRRR
jgi:hypothetical protein